MLLIPCPWCGPRSATEFNYSGESIPRPDPRGVDPVAWRGYLYTRSNPAGWTTEKWYHGSGCRKYLIVERHTVTNEIRSARLAVLRSTPNGSPEAGGSAADA